MQNIFVEFLPPWIETGLQPAFYDKESGTVLQQVARMYAKVNWLIKIFNDFSKDTTHFVNDFVDSTNTEIQRFEHDTTETVNDYIARFVALKDFVDDYFDNLDVQEEINNKLDDMLAQGTLQEIITTYIQSNVAWAFDSVADMKLATNLIDGSFAQTIGYHAINDGGGAIYKIRTKTVDDTIDDMFIVSLYDNTLIAELVTNDIINVKQLGAYGDDTHNDTLAFQTATSKDNIEIFVPSGTYIINEGIELGTHTTLAGEGNSSIIKCGTSLSGGWLITIPVTSLHCTIKDLYIEGDFKCNGIYDGETTGNRAGIRSSIINVKIYHCNNALYLNAMGSMVTDCLFYGDYNLSETPTTEIGIYVAGTDNGISNTRVSGFMQYGIFNATSASGTRYSNIKSYLNGVGVYLRGSIITASILQSEENFQDNFQLYAVYDSTLDLVSDSAGVEAQNGGDTIPTTLNEYAYLNIDYCRNDSITISIGNRIVTGSETWSCAGKVIKFARSIGIDINAVCYSFTQSTVYPQLIDADTLVGSKLKLNGFEYWRELPKRTVTLHGLSNTTLNSQDGDDYNITIKPTATGGVAMMYFDAPNCSKIVVNNRMSEGVIISDYQFRYTANGTTYNIYNFQSSHIGNITSNFSNYRTIIDIDTLLADNAQYQEFVSQGATISGKMILCNINLNTSVISDRANIDAVFEIYGE